MQNVDLISLSDTSEYIKIIEEFASLRNSFKIRKRHYDLDMQRGFVNMANSRIDKINEIKAQIEQLQPRVKDIALQADQNLAIDAKYKPARLVRLYCDLLITAPHDLMKLQQKISTLRSQVFKNSSQETLPVNYAKSTEKATASNNTLVQPEQMSLFD